METFQFLLLIAQLAFLMVVLYIPYVIITKMARAFTKTTKKTKAQLFN